MLGPDDREGHELGPRAVAVVEATSRVQRSWREPSPCRRRPSRSSGRARRRWGSARRTPRPACRRRGSARARSSPQGDPRCSFESEVRQLPASPGQFGELLAVATRQVLGVTPGDRPAVLIPRPARTGQRASLSPRVGRRRGREGLHGRCRCTTSPGRPRHHHAQRPAGSLRATRRRAPRRFEPDGVRTPAGSRPGRLPRPRAGVVVEDGRVPIARRVADLIDADAVEAPHAVAHCPALGHRFLGDRPTLCRAMRRTRARALDAKVASPTIGRRRAPCAEPFARAGAEVTSERSVRVGQAAAALRPFEQGACRTRAKGSSVPPPPRRREHAARTDRGGASSPGSGQGPRWTRPPRRPPPGRSPPEGRHRAVGALRGQRARPPPRLASRTAERS